MAVSAPAITTNVVVFSLRDGQLKLLLVRRGADPFKNMWALPGGDLQPDEDGFTRDVVLNLDEMLMKR